VLVKGPRRGLNASHADAFNKALLEFLGRSWGRIERICPLVSDLAVRLETSRGRQ